MNVLLYKKDSLLKNLSTLLGFEVAIGCNERVWAKCGCIKDTIAVADHNHLKSELPLKKLADIIKTSKKNS